VKRKVRGFTSHNLPLEQSETKPKFITVYSILPKINEKDKKRLTKAFAVVLQIYYNFGKREAKNYGERKAA
jgi:hypothetical protein